LFKLLVDLVDIFIITSGILYISPESSSSFYFFNFVFSAFFAVKSILPMTLVSICEIRVFARNLSVVFRLFHIDI